MEKKYDESEGVWRTIGGRKVFIRTGQSLGDAMKASGKFKKLKNKDNTSNQNKLKELAEGYTKGGEEGRKNYVEADNDLRELTQYAWENGNVEDFEKFNKMKNDLEGEFNKLNPELKQKLSKQTIEKLDYINNFIENKKLQPLYDEVKKQTGLNNVKFMARSKYSYNGEPYLEIGSSNIKDEIGAMGAAFRNVQVQTFNTWTTKKEDGSWRVHGDIDFRYETQGGGTNGVRVLSYEYDSKTKKWNFMTEKDRYDDDYYVERRKQEKDRYDKKANKYKNL